MRTNVLVWDMDIGVFNPLDTRRLEVVVDGLPLFRGAQIAVDTTLVCPLTREGRARPRCANVSGAAITAARRRKENSVVITLGPASSSWQQKLAGDSPPKPLNS